MPLIIEVEQDCDEPQIVTIVVNRTPYKKVHRQIFGACPTFVAETLEELDREFARREYVRAQAFLMKRLSRRSYHTQEVFALLSRKLISAKTIEHLIAECCRLGYLDDGEMIAHLIRGSIRRGEGPHKILGKLKRRRIDSDPLSLDYPAVEQVKQIQRLLQTRYANKDLKQPQERARVARALGRRGFDFELIYQALERE